MCVEWNIRACIRLLGLLRKKKDNRPGCLIQRIYSLTVWRPELVSRCDVSRAVLPPKLEGRIPPASLAAVVLALWLHHSNLCLCLRMALPSTVSPSFLRALVIGFSGHPYG